VISLAASFTLAAFPWLVLLCLMVSHAQMMSRWMRLIAACRFWWWLIAACIGVLAMTQAIRRKHTMLTVVAAVLLLMIVLGGAMWAVLIHALSNPPT